MQSSLSYSVISGEKAPYPDRQRISLKYTAACVDLMHFIYVGVNTAFIRNIASSSLDGCIFLTIQCTMYLGRINLSVLRFDYIFSTLSTQYNLILFRLCILNDELINKKKCFQYLIPYRVRAKIYFVFSIY